MTIGALTRATRTLRFAGDLLFVPKRGPFKLTYIVTDECSCRCAICHLWKEPRKGATTREIEDLFRANPELSWINLSGGEVAEREDFAAIAAAAVGHTRCAALDFPTAGQRPDRVVHAARAALDAGAPRLFVTVSLDGPPHVHDALRGTDGAFELARETIRELKSLRARRLEVAIGVTFSSRNDADPESLVDALLAAAPEIARHELHFNLAHHAPHYYKNRAADAPHGEAIPVLRTFFRRERERRGFRLSPLSWVEQAYWRLADDYLRDGRSPLSCTALLSSAYVDPNLVLYPCATWDHPLGDLREHGLSIARAVESAAARSARRAAATLACPNCWTPCEAYPTLLSNRTATLRACARDLDRGPEAAVAATRHGGSP